MSGSLLLVGDMHLGRRPARMPPALLEEGLRPQELGPAAAWRRAVERALEEGIDAVVLAGDLVDAENALFEAMRPLDVGVRALTDAGIAVVAVAGNHDGRTLPRLAQAIPRFQLLGQGGVWEEVLVRRRGDPKGKPFARLLGWSFPDRHHLQDPLIGFPTLERDLLPTFGLLHADLDAAGSSYAPVARSALTATGLDGWFLGHVHTPSPLGGERPLGYLGSLVGLDPGEPGARGPVRLDIDDAGKWQVERIDDAPLRWERVEVEVATVDELAARLREGLEEVRARLGAEGSGARAVGCRVTVRGRVADPCSLRARLASEDIAALVLRRGDVALFVEKIYDETRPELSLESLSDAPTPAGLLARKILAWENGDREGDAWLRAAQDTLRARAATTQWNSLETLDLALEEVRARMLRTAYVALEELLAGADLGAEAATEEPA